MVDTDQRLAARGPSLAVVLRVVLVGASLLASVGCQSFGNRGVDDAFLKKVAADPFPTAQQQGISSATAE